MTRMTTRKFLGATAIAALLLITGCTPNYPGENKWTSNQGHVPYQLVVAAYQDGALNNTLDHADSKDSFEETLELALEMDAILTGMIMRGLGEHRIDKAAKRNRKEATAAANDAALEALVDRLDSIVEVLYDQGVITFDDVTTAAERRGFKPGEIDELFNDGFPVSETINSNESLGLLIYSLGDSNMDINQYKNFYEATFYDVYAGPLHGQYFDRQRPL